MGFQNLFAPVGRSRRLAVAAFAILASAGAVMAQADSDGTTRVEIAPPAHPGLSGIVAGGPARSAGERPQSLRLEFAARTVSFGIVQGAGALTSGSVPFAPGSWEVTNETRRALAALRTTFRGKAAKDAAFAIVVSGGDEVVAYRRARALRSELIDRHREDANRIVAAAGEAQGVAPDSARIEFVVLDPARCSGCGETPLKTIALDSGVAKLVRASTDGSMIAGPGAVPPMTMPAMTVPATIPAPAPVMAAPLPPPRPAIALRDQTAPRALPEKPRAAARTEEKSERRQAKAIAQDEPQAAPIRPARAAAPAPRREARIVEIDRPDYEPLRRSQRAERGCPRPDIIIDDYYRGGPLVACDGALRRRR